MPINPGSDFWSLATILCRMETRLTCFIARLGLIILCFRKFAIMVAYLVRQISPASADENFLGLFALCLRIGLERLSKILLRSANSFNNLLKLSSIMGSSKAFDISKNGKIFTSY